MTVTVIYEGMDGWMGGWYLTIQINNDDLEPTKIRLVLTNYY